MWGCRAETGRREKRRIKWYYAGFLKIRNELEKRKIERREKDEKRVKLCREWEVGGIIGDSHSTHGGGSSACRRIQSNHEVSQMGIETVRQQPRCFLFLLGKRKISG